MSVYVIIINFLSITMILLLLQRAQTCRECGARAPMFRKPTSLKAALWGGWTCPDCGRAVDSSGRAAAR
jgi:hypothetical protein